jgi:UDP-2-acetamido-2-deoxy-ribo-hexuluronate aminotransferase
VSVIERERKLQMVDVVGQYQRYQSEIDAAIMAVVRSGAYINGPAVRDFEASIASYLGVRHAIGCASGTDALQLIFMALDLKPGDEIITTPFTFVATTETIALLGLKPVYADIDPKTFNIDPEKIEEKITSRTRAILPVHLFGQPCDMTKLNEIAKRRNLEIIEDAAQALGAKWNGKMACTLGKAAAISFYPSKNLGAFGDAGMVTTDDDDLAERIRSIANHGSTKTYFHDKLGVNSRLDSIQAAILNTKLQYLDEWNAARGQAAAWYNQRFANYEHLLTTPRVDDRAQPIWHQYSLILKKDRSAVTAKLKVAGIPHNIYYPVPLHLQPAYASFGGVRGQYPNAEFAADNILSLPMHSELKEEDVDFIASSVIEALQSI